MTRLKGPLFSLGAQKQLGKTLIYKMKGGRSFLTKYNKPGSKAPFSASPAQLDKRMLYNLIIACWQCKTDNQRAVFDNEAKSKNLKMSGWNLFYQKAIMDPYTYMGLAGYWSFNKIVNGKILDLSGNENDGTPMPSYPDNAPQLVDGIGGKFGKAMAFDGIDDYVNYGNDVSLQINNNITIEMWFKPPFTINSDLSENFFLFRKRIDDPRQGYNAWFRLNEGKLDWFIQKDGNWNALFSVQNTWHEGTWYHLVFTYDANTQKIYTNGQLDNHMDTAQGMKDANTTLKIQCTLGGLVDEFRIYNRALGNPEILKHFEIGRKYI